MSKTLKEIAQQLIDQKTKSQKTKRPRVKRPKDLDNKVQLIYGFNGTGKTRLSREFKKLSAPKDDEAEDQAEFSRPKILYYNAFTEDLFSWDNDLEDVGPKLKMQRNSYTEWLINLLKDLGIDGNIIKNFQRYANNKLTPKFNADYTEVTFSFQRGTDEQAGNFKISRGEESSFIWSIFYTLLDEVVAVLNTSENNGRESDQFNQLKYVFIDDPVTSLDENYLIEMAVNLAGLIKVAPSDLKFIITTHSPLFYNILHSELGLKKGCYLLEHLEDGTFNLDTKKGSANTSFSYHLYLKQILEKAIADNQIEKFHFTLLRNLYEKTAAFLGYEKWADLLNTLPDDKEPYVKHIMHFASHSRLSNEEIAEPTNAEKQIVKYLLKNLHDEYSYCPKKEK